MDSEVRLRTKPYDKRVYFNFPIVNVIFIDVVTFDRVAPVCEEYIPHLIQSLWFLTRKLLTQGYLSIC